MSLTDRFAVSGHHFHESPSELADSIRGLGARGVDAWPWNFGDDPVAAAGAFAEAGIQVLTVNVPGATARLCDPSGDETLVSAGHDAIDLAVEIDAQMVQLYAAPSAASSALAAADELAYSLASLLERAEEAGVMLTVENNLDQRGEDSRKSNPSRDPDVLARSMQILASGWVGVAFDPCNFTTVQQEPYPYSYEILQPWIVNVHLKDCTRYDPRRHRASSAGSKLLIDSHGGAYLPKPVGQGAVPWNQIVERLTEDGYDGWWTLDPFIVASELRPWCEESVRWLETQPALAGLARTTIRKDTL